ncbi:MAG: CoA transferase [Spirosomataceae bacterium]
MAHEQPHTSTNGYPTPQHCPIWRCDLCADKKPILLAVGTEKQFASLCQVIGSGALIHDERFCTNQARVENRSQLNQLLTQKIAVFESTSLLEALEKLKVPAAAIRNMQEVFELPAAQALILEEKWPDGTISKRVKTVAFEIR